MTGLWPHTNGCTRNSVPLDSHHRTFVELQDDPEYVAGYMGKWHLGNENERQRGFNEWISTEGASDYARFLMEKGESPDKGPDKFSTEKESRLPLELSKPQFLEENACDFIRRYKTTPFILYVAFVEPHSPYFGPLNAEHALTEVTLDETSGDAPSSDVPLRYRLMREWQEEQALLDRKRLPEPYYFGLTPEEYRTIRQRYLGLVTMVDRSIGGILACLEDHGLRENTIVVHTSDHGDMLGAHRLFGKEVMYEEATRVPLLVSMAGQTRIKRIEQPVSHIDLVPTLLDLLGSSPKDACQGTTLAPLLRGDAGQPSPVFIEWSPNRTKLVKRSVVSSSRRAKRAMEESTRSIVTPDGWKCNLRDCDISELYRLADDPRERVNLFNDQRYSDVVSRCRFEIQRWQESVGDTLKL